MKSKMVITISGETKSGKSCLAREISRFLTAHGFDVDVFDEDSRRAEFLGKSLGHLKPSQVEFEIHQERTQSSGYGCIASDAPSEAPGNAGNPRT